MKRNSIQLLASLLLMFGSSNLTAQNIGEYLYPFDNNRINLNSECRTSQEAKEIIETFFEAKNYQELQFKLASTKESIATRHHTFQVYLADKIVEQAMVKLHVTHGKSSLLQHNLPTPSVWNELEVVHSNLPDADVWLVLDAQLIPARHKLLIEEKTDHYANTFVLSDGSFFENSIKYHSDSLAYAKVFYPDPLSSSGQTYGGNYQDVYVKDTSALLIQNINNPGGNTVTANGINYNFNGQTFNIPTESYVNNFTAPVIRQVFESITIDGQGVVLGYETALTDDLASYITEIKREDYNFPELAAEQVWKSFPLDYSGGTFNLTNNFFIISEFSVPFTNPAMSTIDSFEFTRNQVQFEDVNTFYHLNNYKAYWESLGFTDLASEVILIDAHGNNGADNSFFSPTNPPRLVFGQGGVDDAEDADVIIHEYGHGISNFASPNSNTGNQRRALDEGFGDYLAFSYSRSITPFNAFSVFSWDGHNEYWNGRIANSPKTALDIDEGQSIYYNGEIWSATMKDLHSALGRTITDQLAIEVMYYNMPNGSMTQAALNLFKADTALYNGIHSCDIFNVLYGRKFVLGTCADFYAGVTDNFSTDGAVQLQNSYGFTYQNENLVLSSTVMELEGSNLQIWDMNGKLVQANEVPHNNFEIDGEAFAPGIYFLVLRTKANAYRFKIVKN